MKKTTNGIAEMTKRGSSDFRRQNAPLHAPMRDNNYTPSSDGTDRRCYICGEVGHLAVKCKQAKKESSCPQNTVQPAPKPGQQAPKYN